jgi:hypothetical protein
VPPESDGAFYLTAPEHAGVSAVFAYDPDAECEHCRTNADMIYGDTVPITMPLTSYLQSNTSPDAWPPADLRVLSSLEQQPVVEFLKKNLEWRIVDMAGNVKTAEEVSASGLETLVADRTFTYPKAENVSSLGEYGSYTYHPEITLGKVGGYVSGL